MPENLDLVRSIYAAWGRGDFGSTGWAHPDIEYAVVDGPEPGSWTGTAAMQETIRGILDMWQGARIEADEYKELDDERVLVLNHLIGRGKASGLNVGQMPRNGAALVHVSAGKVTKYVSYNDRERALADLGLAAEGMSQENVEIVRAAIDAFNRRDADCFDALLADDAEIFPVRAALEGTVYRGCDAGSQYCAAVEASWEDLRWDVEEVREGENWVLALGRIQGRGRGSGAAINARGAWLAHFRGGLVTSFRTYPNRVDGLNAVGLAE
jgi:ketosteroid isomerase-like protein